MLVQELLLAQKLVSVAVLLFVQVLAPAAQLAAASS
ncbi:putative membrane protein [Candidatus Protofrankia californiensis]|uniref:Putative membrane protein n=1 Tax=Candidatus Protofrankia californiensis TaxID=1839754 RepID=A0A1C3P4Q0_9ACTN|nr:putative membrane protein [Candidatus Protofrankia californiensis]